MSRTLSILIPQSLFTVEVTIVHNLCRLLKMYAIQGPTKWKVNAMFDWDTPHRTLCPKVMAVTLCLIHGQSIFITTQQTDQLKS